MKVHFIAIGGSAMHNLAIALKNKGFEVTGSDDAIFEPSKTRLEQKGILPKEFGIPILQPSIQNISSVNTGNKSRKGQKTNDNS